MGRGRGPRPHSGHRKRRRRGSGRPQGSQAGALRTTRVPVLDGCPTAGDWACAWHGECAACGDVIHLGPMLDSAGNELPESIAATYRTLVVGSPPRCVDCRGRP